MFHLVEAKEKEKPKEEKEVGCTQWTSKSQCSRFLSATFGNRAKREASSREQLHLGKPKGRFALSSRTGIVRKTCVHWHPSNCILFKRRQCNNGSKCHFIHSDKKKTGDESSEN